MGVVSCDGCEECHTTLAEAPDLHKAPTEHKWQEEWTIDRKTGERGKERICLACLKREPIVVE